MVKLIRVAALSADPLRLDGLHPPADVLEVMEGRWRERVEAVANDDVDLIVLPEHGDRPHQGFYPADLLSEYYELRGEQFSHMFAKYAAELKANIAYSGLRLHEGKKFNSTILFDREGRTAGIYDKSFLTPGEIGRKEVQPGPGAKAFDLDIGRVAPIICFDLNFLELLDSVRRKQPDIILFSSVFHGGYLQSHWAYSAGAYFIGSVYPPNRSTIIDPLGQIVASSTNYTNHTVSTINLDYELVHLDFNRARLARLKKEYGPLVTITDPGQIGVLMVSSLSEEVTSAQMVEEFEVERVSDYFQRVRQYTPSAQGTWD